ncbi:MAG: helix-turn-helix domain-containing protein [Ruminococcus sp.]|nr:helix-turn-helix domain-containing protein [Ruminococcus sp.]
MNSSTEKALSEFIFTKREELFEHASFDREIAFYESICTGNMELVRVFMQPLNCEGCGTLSEDPLRNLKYHMVVLAALIARSCVNGGLSPEEAYSLSDYYIMKTDKCSNEAEVRAVHTEMIEGYTDRMRRIRLGGAYSKQIVRAADYIVTHLHERILLEDVAEHLSISPEHLSRLFRKETGMTFGEYVNRTKIEEAVALLMYTERTDIEITNLLCFSSQSYFIKVFKKMTGATPKQFKKQYEIRALKNK